MHPITFNIDQCTFYACDQKSGKHFIDANKVELHDIRITNCLFANCGSSDAKNKLCSIKGIVKETSDNWYTTDCACAPNIAKHLPNSLKILKTVISKLKTLYSRTVQATLNGSVNNIVFT